MKSQPLSKEFLRKEHKKYVVDITCPNVGLVTEVCIYRVYKLFGFPIWYKLVFSNSGWLDELGKKSFLHNCRMADDWIISNIKERFSN